MCTYMQYGHMLDSACFHVSVCVCVVWCSTSDCESVLIVETIVHYTVEYMVH